ncbi:MAG: 50S ribosomal protein L24 [Rickettsiales bacterium]|nr:50S ribosomal protein L24 [Pseudomonadota bacterium]MDA0967245.1 50S ribosomal protein L24 [Pseudomonadota bacterium]MDG4544094.1 50S ribosomal protein L24 [Rickettsiales bacterium]MDG4546212.1 50S ribosomal protein L24 [Rickettsiales bacterium]MDG4548418.1 50S ribosomal protein L24 [Rickettsiales bacterium]
MAAKFKIKKGDKVVVIAGKDKGKKGEVIELIKSKSRVRVTGVNKVKKHSKPGQNGAGGIIELELPIHISNVAIADPKSGEATKVGFKSLKDGKKVRFSKKTDEVIDN